MIYSRWRPDKGGYDYFESSERYGLGDDLPVPRLPAGTSIGVSSVLAGRVPPAGVALRPLGSGAFARGMVMPTSRAGLQGLGFMGALPVWGIALLSAAAGALACVLIERRSSG